MARVPSIFSDLILGERLVENEPQPPPLHTMSSKEVDAFVLRCDHAMASHATDFRAGHDKDAALAAFEAVLSSLLEVRAVYPAKRADIDAVLVAHGYPVPAN